MTWLLPTLMLSFGNVTPAAALAPTGLFVAQVDVPGGDSTAASAAPDGPAEDGSDKGESTEKGEDKKQGGGDFLTSLMIMGAIFLFFWLVFIRPQSKQMKEHKKLVSELKVGDPIVTQGGMFARIVGFDDEKNAVNLEISKGVRVLMLRGQVARRQDDSKGKDAKAARS